MDKEIRVFHTTTLDSHSIVLWEPTAHLSSASNRKLIVLLTQFVEVMPPIIDLITSHYAHLMTPTWSVQDCSFHQISKA
jgi:energy-coupling factor transporter ATP-binding protein EcfA2